MRCGGQEQAVLEAPAQIADGAGELGFDAVAAAARRRRVVGLVQDQQAAGRQVAEPLAHGIGIGRVDEQVVRNQEPAVRAPRVDAEAPLPAHLRQVGAVQDHEQEAEALLHLRFPLLQHGCGGGHHHGARLLAQQQLAGDEPGLDGFSKAGVVGDEQVHAGEAKRLAQRLHLVGVDLDAGAERRLEQVRVGGRDAVPAQGVQERAEVARRVEAFLPQVAPRLLFQDAAVDLEVPVDVQGLTLRIVVGAGQTHPRRLARGLVYGFHQPAPRTYLYQFADMRGAVGEVGCRAKHDDQCMRKLTCMGNAGQAFMSCCRAEPPRVPASVPGTFAQGCWRNSQIRNSRTMPCGARTPLRRRRR